MKIFLLCICVLLVAYTTLCSQDTVCDCKADIYYLNEKIEKTPAFRENKKAYQNAFASALQDAKEKSAYFECFELLNRLTISLQDWHITIREKAHDSLTKSNVIYPEINFNLDSLRQVLSEKALDSIEGIYFRKDLSIGVVYNTDKKVYHAIILKTASPGWEQGEIVYTFIPLPNQYIKTIGAQYPSKRLISYYDRINMGQILRAIFQKDTITQIYARASGPDTLFIFKEIYPGIDYIKAGSFSSQYPVLREAEDFYKSLTGKLSKKNLILDLRDNGGGGDRNSDILFKQLQKYLKSNNIYIITNARTGSNAEQFTVKLKKYPNVTSLGDRTAGALTYEIKPTDFYSLPSSNFSVILTSKAHKKFLPYEGKGVIPEYYLNYTEDWISQVTELIDNQPN